MLIKLNYKLDKINEVKYKLTVDELYYNLYSINDLKSLSFGKEKITYKKSVNKNHLNKVLNKLGYSLLKKIVN